MGNLGALEAICGLWGHWGGWGSFVVVGGRVRTLGGVMSFRWMGAIFNRFGEMADIKVCASSLVPAPKPLNAKSLVQNLRRNAGEDLLYCKSLVPLRHAGIPRRRDCKQARALHGA